MSKVYVLIMEDKEYDKEDNFYNKEIIGVYEKKRKSTRKIK